MNLDDSIQHITALNEKLEVQGSMRNFSVLSIFPNPTQSIEPSSSPNSSVKTFLLHLVSLLWARVLFSLLDSKFCESRVYILSFSPACLGRNSSPKPASF